MGNTNSTFHSEYRVVASDYQLLGKTSHIPWGELYEMKNIKTGQMVFMQEKHAFDLNTYRKTAQACAQHISLKHNNLARTYGFAGSDAVDPFTNTYKVCVFFEHVDLSLQCVIRDRKGNLLTSSSKSPQKSIRPSHYFEEFELIRFLRQLIDVFCFLQCNGMCQGDITPAVIFLAKNLTVKIIDKQLIYNDLSAFDMAKQGSFNVFLTPMELEALENEAPKPAENKYKADVFRLGMTLLECATLQRSAQIYDWNSHSLSLDVLTERLIEVRERYSPEFYNTLREMLRFEEHKRPDFMMLNKSLQEEATQALTSGISQCQKDEESFLKKSTFEMGPKLLASVPASPGDKLTSRLKRQSSFGPKMQDQNFGPVGREGYEIGPNEGSKKREEDLEEDMNEGSLNLSVNKVPFSMKKIHQRSKSMANGVCIIPPKQMQEKAIFYENEKKNILDTSGPSPPTEVVKQKSTLALRDFYVKKTPTKPYPEKDRYQSAIHPPMYEREESLKNDSSSANYKVTFGDTFSSPSPNRKRKPLFPAGGSPISTTPVRNNYTDSKQQARDTSNSQINQSQLSNMDSKSQLYISMNQKSPCGPNLSNQKSEYLSVRPMKKPEGVEDTNYFVPSMSELQTASSNPPSNLPSTRQPIIPVNILPQAIMTNSYGFAEEHDDSQISQGPAVPFVSYGLVKEEPVSLAKRHLPMHTRSVSSQYGSQSVSKMTRLHTREEETLKTTLNTQESSGKKEHELVEAILKRVLNSAGISPNKAIFSTNSAGKNIPSYAAAKRQNMLRPSLVEALESRGGGKVAEKRSGEQIIGNVRKKYNIGGTSQAISTSAVAKEVKGKSSVKQVSSPVKQVNSSVKKVSSPVKEVGSPTRFMGSQAKRFEASKQEKHEVKNLTSPKFGVQEQTFGKPEVSKQREIEKKNNMDYLEQMKNSLNFVRGGSLGRERTPQKEDVKPALKVSQFVGNSMSGESTPHKEDMKSPLKFSQSIGCNKSDSKDINVEDRFKMAMERTNRSKAFLREIAERSRSPSIEPPTKRGKGSMFASVISDNTSYNPGEASPNN